MSKHNFLVKKPLDQRESAPLLMLGEKRYLYGPRWDLENSTILNAAMTEKKLQISYAGRSVKSRPIFLLQQWQARLQLRSV